MTVYAERYVDRGISQDVFSPEHRTGHDATPIIEYHSTTNRRIDILSSMMRENRIKFFLFFLRDTGVEEIWGIGTVVMVWVAHLSKRCISRTILEKASGGLHRGTRGLAVYVHLSSHGS